MQGESKHSNDTTHQIEFISINKNKVIYQCDSGFVEKCFSTNTEARNFVATLTSESN